jgi:hypothetical protein
MANRVIRALPRSTIDLSGLALGGKAGITLARRIDVSEFSEITAYVRFHQGTQLDHAPVVASIVFDADGHTEEDPGATFVPRGSPSKAISFQTIVTFNAFPLINGTAMRVVPIAAGFGSLMSIGLVVTANAVTTGVVQWIMSIDLICKCSDPGADYYEECEPLLSDVMD